MIDMTNDQGAGEHILVCLSPSPSNPKVIAAAVKMADAFHAALSAIYVRPTDYDSLPDEDKSRLLNNIRIAEESGASVTTVVGDDVAAQIAEFIHISGTTKVVVGQSAVKRRRLWNKTPLTEQIITRAPYVDVYIIPDSSADFKKEKERFAGSDWTRPTLKELGVSIFLLAASTVLGLIFTQFGFSDSNIITVFILGVLVISVLTVNPLFGAFGSLASVLLFNWFFIEPRFSFHAYEAEYPVTFAIMLISSLITGTLANRIKRSASQSAREAFRTNILLETSQLLQKAERADEVMSTTARQIIVLLDRDVVIFPRGDDGVLKDGLRFSGAQSGADASDPDDEEKEIAEWVFRTRQPAGFRMDRYGGSESQYHPIFLNDYCYGVIAIRLNSVPMEPFENSIVMSVLGECALALDNLRNAEEKEQASIVAKNEQLRSNLLRSISHDIRTPLTSISGNADNLLAHYRQLDDETLEQIFSDIYDDSEWLIDLVENLLSLSRIENGQMDLNTSLEVLDDVIEEALKHIDRNADRYDIRVTSADEILLVDMDSRLIMQVLINLINNAVKNTPPGTIIRVESERSGDNAVVKVIDNGPGIPDDMKPYVFEMFYTGQSKVADGRRGMGLGLALCRSIMEAHNGTITLTDNEPSGCCFTITLPMKEVQIDE